MKKKYHNPCPLCPLPIVLCIGTRRGLLKEWIDVLNTRAGMAMSTLSAKDLVSVYSSNVFSAVGENESPSNEFFTCDGMQFSFGHGRSREDG